RSCADPVVLLSIAIALLPVLVFLLALLAMDSFKLLPPRTLTFAIGFGVLAAVLCLMLHRQAVAAGLAPAALKRFVAPLTEETAKAALVVSLLMRRRLGF